MVVSKGGLVTPYPPKEQELGPNIAYCQLSPPYHVMSISLRIQPLPLYEADTYPQSIHKAKKVGRNDLPKVVLSQKPAPPSLSNFPSR
jgi:hypothetical protein